MRRRRALDSKEERLKHHTFTFTKEGGELRGWNSYLYNDWMGYIGNGLFMNNSICMHIISRMFVKY